VARSQVEIDDFHDYEKAIGALGESYKVLSKATSSDPTSQEIKLNDLKNRIILTKKFLQIKRYGYFLYDRCIISSA